MSACRQPHWDPLVRLTHWGVASAVLINGVIVEDGSLIHVWVGYGMLALVVLRLIWGMVGSEEARFSSFPFSPKAAIAHIAEIRSERSTQLRSHNPLGALMVYALWAILLVVAVSGIGMAGSPFSYEGRDQDKAVPGVELGVYDDDDYDDEHDDDEGGEELLEEVHELAANLLFLFAALHIGGVIFESRRTGTNLVWPMVTGKSRSIRDT